MENFQSKSSNYINLLITLLVFLSILVGAYYTLRFGGWSMEVDASRQAITADGIIQTGRLENARAYNNGFGYGAFLAAVSLATGIDIKLVQISSSMWVFVVLLVGFIAFKELLGSVKGGLVAAFLLMLQPDFMFYIVRGSHERMTWMYALLMLFLLLRSQRSRSIMHLLIYILLFYLTFWAMAMSNVYFASTYMLAISIGLAIGWAFERLIFRKREENHLSNAWWQRLLLISLTCFILVFIFIVYTYRPAQSYFQIFRSLVDQLSLLFLGTETATNPIAYQYFDSAWRYPGVYFIATGAQWFISLVGLAVWVWATFHANRLNQQHRLLWQLYTSFGILLTIGIAADFAGFLSSNLQVRMFTPFAIFSGAMFVLGGQILWPKLSSSFKTWMVPAIGIVTMFAFIAVQAKITNDPLISNQWVFYSPAEVRAGQWVNKNMPDEQVWVDTWDHLQNALAFQGGYELAGNKQYVYQLSPGSFQNVMVSQSVQLRANRSGISLPSLIDHSRIYDNGFSQIYHLRAWTPYQR